MFGKSEITEVNERITLHRFIETPYNEGNIACIAMNDGLIFVDAGRLKSNALKFRQEMEKKFNLPTKLFVATHTHMDHLFGMAAFNGVPTIMAETGKEAIMDMYKQGLHTEEGRKARLDAITEHNRNEGMDLPPGWLEDFVPNQIKSEWFQPQILVKDRITISDQKSEHEVEFVVCGGHSPCSAYLYDRTSKTMFTGDNLNSEHADSGPCMLFRAYLGIDLMEQWLVMDVEKFVPGHGRVVDKAYLENSLDYFTQLRRVMQELKKNHTPKENLFNHPTIPPFYEEKTPEFMNRVLEIWYDDFGKE